MKGPIVYYLVKSLTTEEHLKYIGRVGENKQDAVLLTLYKAFHAAKNSHQFKQSFRPNLPENTQKYFTQYCAKLNASILSFLREEEANIDVERKLIQYLGNIKLLLGRRLYKSALDYINKAKTLIEEYHLHAYSSVLYTLEIVYHAKTYKSMEDIENRNKELEASYKYVASYGMLKNLQSHFLQEYNNKDLREKILTEERCNLFMLDEHLDKDTIANYTKLQIEEHIAKGFYFINKLVWEKAQFHFREAIAVFDLNPLKESQEFEAYWACLTNYLQCANKSKKFDKIDEIEERILTGINIHKSKFPTNVYEHKRFLSYVTLIATYNAQGKTEATKNYTNEVKSILKDKTYVIPTLETFANYQLAYRYFLMEDYTTALQYTNLTFETVKNKQESRYYFAARILELLIHSELKEEVLLKSLIRSFNRGKWAEYRDADIEKIFRKVLMDTLNRDFKKKSKAEYDKLIKELENTPYSRYYYDGFDLLAWVTAKHEDIKFAEALKKMYS